MPETLYVLAASYDDVRDALAEFKAIEGAWRHVSSSHDFDAAVVAKGDDGKVDIVQRHDEPTRHGAAQGLGYGLAVGAVAVLFPFVGVGALALGAGSGAAIGAVAGHAAGMLSRDDLKTLGEVLDGGDAGLVVVYPRDMADRVSVAITKAKAKVDAKAGVSGEALAADVRAAQAKAAPSS